MGIYITPLERIRKLQAENARLRSLVGEPYRLGAAGIGDTIWREVVE